MVWHLVPIDIGLAVSTGVSFQVYRISGAAVVRACQNRITRCAVARDSRSKFVNALSSPVLEDLMCGRDRMTARAVGHPQPAALHRIRIGSGRSPLMRRSTTSIGTLQRSSRKVARHFAIAALHQHIGDRLCNPRPPRYGQKMGLALGLRDTDEIGIIEPR